METGQAEYTMKKEERCKLFRNSYDGFRVVGRSKNMISLSANDNTYQYPVVFIFPRGNPPVIVDAGNWESNRALGLRLERAVGVQLV